MKAAPEHVRKGKKGAVLWQMPPVTEAEHRLIKKMLNYNAESTRKR